MNQKDFIKVVNQHFDLRQLLIAMGFHIDRVPMTLRCPFHEDRSKSAKIFADNRLFCWTCHKMFGAYDALDAMGVRESEIKRQLSKMGVVLLEKEKEFTVNEEHARVLKTKYRLGEIPMKKMLDGLYFVIRAGEKRA